MHRPRKEAGGCLGELLDELRRDELISKTQYEAGMVLYAGMLRGGGTSAGLASSFMDKIDSSLRMPLWPAGGATVDDLAATIINKLRAHEQATLRWMVTYREKPRGRIEHMVIGVYETTRMNRAFVIGRICSLLDSVAELVSAVWVPAQLPYARYVPSAHHPPGKALQAA